MKFDWKQFCEEYDVPYITEGTNVAHGFINIRCPYCADGDPSYHLGLKQDIHEPMWGCWRNRQHRGRHPRRLVQRLLRCSFEDAKQLVQNQQTTTPDEAELERAVDAIRPRDRSRTHEKQSRAVKPHHSLPAEFRPLWDKCGDSPYRRLFLDYLTSRGFGLEAAELFRLHYALTGLFAWRIIVPFYVGGELLGWTGRDVREKAVLRYRAEGSKDLVFNADVALAAGASTLLIVEGPFDAMKLHFYGQRFDCAAVATLGTAVTATQIKQLAWLTRKFKHAVLLFDRDQLAGGLPIAEELEALSGCPTLMHILEEYKDPGEMPSKHIETLCTTLTQKCNRLGNHNGNDTSKRKSIGYKLISDMH